LNQTQSGNAKAGITHHLELYFSLAEGSPPAGGNPGEQGRHRAGVRDRGCLRPVWRCSPGCHKKWRWVAGQGGADVKESHPADSFHDITCPHSIPEGMITLLCFIQCLESIG